MFARPPALDLANTAGEVEREALSRRWNVVEPFVVMTVLLAGAWLLAYPVGVLHKVEAANTVCRVLTGLLLIFILFVSPWLHRDTPASRGLGSPWQIRSMLERTSRTKRLALCSGMAVLIGLLTAVAYQHAAGVLRFLFGVPTDTVLRFQSGTGGMMVVLLAALILATLWATCIIRYDNFGPALRTAGRLLAVFLPVTLLDALAMNGLRAFADPDPKRLLGNAFGYVFWGAFQQLIFCAYFGTRLRKGFAPTADLRAQTRRRLGVAVLSGFFFGLIHINSWYLAGVTWLLGACLSWVFMQDRNRNLLALGVVHGVLGTCVGWLFRRGNDVFITMRVGPWGMQPAPDWVTITVTTLLIAAFCTFIVVAARSQWDRLEPEPASSGESLPCPVDADPAATSCPRLLRRSTLDPQS